MAHKNLFAVQSLDPITESVNDLELYFCFPLDLGPDSLPSTKTRYCSLIAAPSRYRGSDLMAIYERERSIAVRWITYIFLKVV